MKSLVVANWKMNPASFKEAKALFAATKKAADAAKHVSVIVAPPAIFARELRALYSGKRIGFALQSAHADAGGAHTGEISLAQAKDARISYIIVGHAERRAAGETNDDTRQKVAGALLADMTPILCVGETVRNTDGEYFSTVKEQLRVALADVLPAKLKDVIIVYEPLWTIGKDVTMSPRDMHEMAIFIRKSVMELSASGGKGYGAVMNVRILYGGSVDEKNVGAMLKDGDVHGFLVGRASVRVEHLSALLQAIEQTA